MTDHDDTDGPTAADYDAFFAPYYRHLDPPTADAPTLPRDRYRYRYSTSPRHLRRYRLTNRGRTVVEWLMLIFGSTIFVALMLLAYAYGSNR